MTTHRSKLDQEIRQIKKSVLDGEVCYCQDYICDGEGDLTDSKLFYGLEYDLLQRGAGYRNRSVFALLAMSERKVNGVWVRLPISRYLVKRFRMFRTPEEATECVRELVARGWEIKLISWTDTGKYFSEND